MRKVFLFLSGLILIAAMCGGMFLAAAIYDTAGKTTVVPYFFQPDDEFHRRPGVPASPEDLGMNTEDFENSRMYNLLMSRVIMEMFYVTPDSDEMQRRLDGDTGLVNMVTPDVFKIWQKEIAPELQQMVTDKKLRMVRIVQIDTEDQYKKVTYELKTWNKPNDMNTLPELSYGTVYLKVFYMPGLRKEMVLARKTVTEYLEDGGNPAAVFKFGILDMVIPQ